MKNAIIFGFLLSPMFFYAQSLPDTLVLQDGGIRTGRVEQYQTGKRIRMSIAGTQTVTISPALVERIIIHPGSSSKKPTPTTALRDATYAFRERGVYVAVQGGLLFGQTPQGAPDLGSNGQASVGYQFTRWLGAGVGAAFDNYSVLGENSGRVAPVFGEVRGYLTAQRRAPYYLLQIGYGFALRSSNSSIVETNGSWMVHPALGLRLNAREDVNFTVDIGYRFQYLTRTRVLEWRGGGERLEERIWHRRLALRVGVLF